MCPLTEGQKFESSVRPKCENNQISPFDTALNLYCHPFYGDNTLDNAYFLR